jgi:hypothetical protein
VLKNGAEHETFRKELQTDYEQGAEQMCSCFVFFRLQRGGLAVSRSGSHGKGIVDDLIDGVYGFALAAAATNVEDPGDEMVVNVAGISEGLKFGFLLHDQGGNSNGLGTMTTENGAELVRHCGRCHRMTP